MMTQRLEISILTAPLAAIDRRVLSLAWYSALRLAQEDSIPFTCGPGRVRSSASGTLPRWKVSHAAVDRRDVPARAARISRASTLGPCGNAHAKNGFRRAVRSLVIRASHNGYADSRVSCRRATFTLGRGSARIHVVLQTKGDRTTLVALCRPELRRVVARALAATRLALAARGIGVDLAAQGVRQCS